MLSVAVTTVAAAAIVQSTRAADLPLKAVPFPSVPAINWTGFYVGGGIAGVFNSADFEQRPAGLFDTTNGSINPRPGAFGYAGFNYQVAPWAVLGIEGGGTWLSSATYRNLGPAVDFLQRSTYVTSVTGRAGIVIQPDTMIYGKVGPAWIETDGIQGFGTPFRQILPAIQSGVGIEYLVTPNIAVRGEINYTYATSTLSLNTGFDVYRPSFLMLDLGLSYKFDAPAGWGSPGTTPGSARPGMAYKAAPASVAAAPFTPNWTGWEIGGFISANGNQVAVEDKLLSETGPYTSFNIGGGWLFGANYQYQRFVIGIEASQNFEAAKFQTAAGSGGLGTNFYRFAKIDRTFALTGRAGWLFTPGTLIYAKAGPSELRLTPDMNYFNAVAPNNVVARNLFGYQAGGGIETFVTSNVSVRAEGLYTYTADTILLNGAVPNQIKLKPYMVTGTLGAALHF